MVTITDFLESERKSSAISIDMFELNYDYNEGGHKGYNEWLSRIDKTDPKHHRYGHLYEGYMNLYSMNYPNGNVKLFQIKPQYPLYYLEDKSIDKEQKIPTEGYLKISGTRFISLAKKAGLEASLPHDKFGDLLPEGVSSLTEKQKFQLARDIGLFNHYKVKAIKYEFIPDTDLTNIFPLISDKAFANICKRQKILIPLGYPNFNQLQRWNFFKENAMAIEITEGHKKACSLISHGYLAIASASITTHSKRKEEGAKKSPVKDDFKEFFKGRENWNITISFDCGDTKASTRKTVRKQGVTLAKKLKKYGKTSLRVWHDYSCKGIDDFLHKYGDLEGTELSIPSYDIKSNHRFGREITADKTIHTRYLSVDLITEARETSRKLLFIKSPQNTGKTTIIKKELESYTDKLAEMSLQGVSVICKQTKEKGVVLLDEGDTLRVHFVDLPGLVIKSVKKSDVIVDKYIARYPKDSETLCLIHRQTLATNLSDKLGLRHYQCSATQGNGEVYCVDSILKEAHISSYTNGFIDECGQVAWHLLSSTTEIKTNRLQKIKRIGKLGKSIIDNNGIIILADADIDDNTIAFYCSLFDVRREECMVVNNTYKPFSERQLVHFEDCASWRQNVYDKIESDERVLIHTSGQKQESTHGSYNLEKDLKERFSDKKIIRLDAITLNDEGHKAYKMLDRLYDLKNYDIIIASSSLNTGVDLTPDVVGTIDSVHGIYYGNYPLNDFEQSLERYRGDCDRYVYLPKFSNNKIVFESTDAKELYERVIGHTRIITELYGIQDVTLANELVGFYCEFASVINNDYSCLAGNFFKRAEDKGYQVKVGANLEKKERVELKRYFKEVREVSTKEYSEEILNAEVIDELEAKRIEAKQSRTYKENLAFTKFNLKRKFLLKEEELTAEVVEIDKYSKELHNRYLLETEKELVEMKDKKKIEFLSKQEEVLYPIDLNSTCHLPTRIAYKELKIIEVIERIKKLDEFTVDDIVNYIDLLRNRVSKDAKEYVKNVLKIDVDKDVPATRLFSRLINNFGYKVTLLTAKRKDKKVKRYYALESVIDEQFYADLYVRWLERDCKSFDEYNKKSVADKLYNK